MTPAQRRKWFKAQFGVLPDELRSWEAINTDLKETWAMQHRLQVEVEQFHRVHNIWSAVMYYDTATRGKK